jgi:choline dehydrogenase-like flavoprotein
MGELYDKHGNLTWGKTLDDKLQYAFKSSRILKFEVFNDWLPTDKNYVSVDDKIRDKWGIPVGKLRLFGHEHDLKVGRYLAQKGEEVLRAVGCSNVSSNISDSPPPNLVAGGCRFGNDPKTSVLDKNCKAHEVENLYVSDGSFMPTGGSVPYTWTIYANAFRVADAIKKALHVKQMQT